MRLNQRGESLLETVLFLPLLLMCGFSGINLGIQAFYRAEIAQLVHAEIERATLIPVENADQIPGETLQRLEERLKLLLPEDTEYGISVALFSRSGTVILQSDRSHGLSAPSLNAPESSPHETFLPYIQSPVSRNPTFLSIGVQSRAPSLFQRSKTLITETLTRTIRRDA